MKLLVVLVVLVDLRRCVRGFSAPASSRGKSSWRRKSPDLFEDVPVVLEERRRERKPEVMSPAGDWTCLKAACNNGADAVYFGLSSFSARARASNFDPGSELDEVVAYCQEREVKTYVALNTLVFDDEIEQVTRLIRRCEEAGVDALIVQDLGVQRLARTVAPNLALHASTQQSISSSSGAEFARERGASRVVVGRELSVSDVARVVRGTSAEIEVFVHGALCVSWSGQCFSSEAWGGRSANRGQCAQACRLPYSLIVDGVASSNQDDLGYLLSPQDLCGLDHVPDLVEAGAACLKIEGRLKDERYVAAVTRAYRNAVDAACAAIDQSSSKADAAVATPRVTRSQLKQVFARGQDENFDGLSAGFLNGANHQNLVRGKSPRHRGLLLGTILDAGDGWVEVSNDESPKEGDGVVVDVGGAKDDEFGGRLTSVAVKGDVAQCFVDGASKSLKGALLWRTSDRQVDADLRKLANPSAKVVPKRSDVRCVVTLKDSTSAQLALSDDEGNVAAAHFDLVSVDDVLESPGWLFLVFPKDAGEPLSIYLAGWESTKPMLTLERLQRWVESSADALRFAANQGVPHPAFGPDFVLLPASPEQCQIWGAASGHLVAPKIARASAQGVWMLAREVVAQLEAPNIDLSFDGQETDESSLDVLRARLLAARRSPSGPSEGLDIPTESDADNQRASLAMHLTRPGPLGASSVELVEERSTVVQDAPMIAPAGATLFGRYALVSRLGRGGAGEVWSARQLDPPHAVRALKLCAIDGSDNELPLLRSEAKLLGQLQHPRIVSIYDSGIIDDQFFIAMDLVRGPSLLAVLKRIAPRDEMLSPAILLYLARCLTEALDYLHARASHDGQRLRVIHRDISPSNILLDAGGRVYLTDFGVARYRLQEHRTRHGVIVGKLGYMAPEQLQGQDIDARVDIFSLGVVLYECATKTRLFPGGIEAGIPVLTKDPEPLEQLRPDLPYAFCRAIHRALARDRSQRFPTALALIKDIEQSAVGIESGHEELGALVERCFPRRAFEAALFGAEDPTEMERSGQASWPTLGLNSPDFGATTPGRPVGRGDPVVMPVLPLTGASVTRPPLTPARVPATIPARSLNPPPARRAEEDGSYRAATVSLGSGPAPRPLQRNVETRLDRPRSPEPTVPRRASPTPLVAALIVVALILSVGAAWVSVQGGLP
ncbi:MAG: U32 family peptidase [Myxococcota bacterium]